ncbi:MAG: CsbD family protein [Gammaproteobacteria bacterium]
MNKDILSGNWKELKGKVKQQWAKLTDDDLTRVEGKVDELKGRIQERYGISKDQAQKELDDFCKKNDKTNS